VIRWLAAINLGLVGLQPVSAGLFLSGYGPAVTLHTIGADALLLAALAQAIAAIVYWRRDPRLAWLARLSIGFVLIVFLQIALGYSKSFWLHVPLGVGLFGGATRLTIRLKSFEERE
jgi:heme A synthase